MTVFNLNQGGTQFSGPLIGGPGSASSPSLAARSLASGLWSPGAGRLSVALSGVSFEFVGGTTDGSIQMTSATISANGLTAMRMPLIVGKNSDGTTLAASAAAGKFAISLTAGTSEVLLSEAANSNTKTDIVVWEFALPATYIAASNITVTANCNYTLGAGTVGTHTLAMAAYLCADAGTQGATLIATAAQTVPAAAGEVTFTITGATLTPGARIMLAGTLVIQDTGASNITAQINSVRLS